MFHARERERERERGEMLFQNIIYKNNLKYYKFFK